MLLMVLTCLHIFQAHAQKTKYSAAQIQKLIEQQKREIQNSKGIDPAEKAKILGVYNSINDKKSSPSKKIETEVPSSTLATGKARLATIPNKVLTTPEIEKFVHDMIEKLGPQLQGSERNFVNNAVAKASGNSVALSNMAVAAWYYGNDKASLMTTLKAAELPHPDAALNNAAAILNQNGFQEKSIPILLYLLSKYANNSTVLNNLGQAYYALGDQQKAKTYLLQCIKKTPDHPEACNTVAMMFLSAGNTTQALDYLEQSLEGAYTEAARKTLEAQRPDYYFIPLLERHFSRPADIPDLNIEMPPLPYDVWSSPQLQNEHAQFQKKIEAVCAALDEKKDASMALEESELIAQENSGISAPFAGVGMELLTHYDSVYVNLLNVKKEFEMQRETDILQKYDPLEQAAIADMTDKHCVKLNGIRSQRQNELSNGYKQYIADCLATSKKHFEQLQHVLPLLSVCPAAYDAEFYNRVREYIWEYYELSHGAYFSTPCDGDGKTNPRDFKFDPKAHPACRYKIAIPFVIGSMKVDCSTFEIEGGELLKLGVKRDFITSQTTLAIGVGVSIQTPITELGAQQNFYISFDGNQQPTDIGMKGEVKGTIGNGVVTESGVEYTMGINSGIDVSATQDGRSFKL